MTSELHPLEPFLPVGARLLMLGSFPPQRVRWSMDFFLPELAERYVAYRRTGIFRGQGVFSDTRRETFRQGTDRAFLRGERIGSLRYGRRDNPIEKQCFRQFSSSSARGRFGAVVGSDSGMPGNRDDGTEGYRCNRAPCRLCRAACGRECGVRLCGPYASALSYALRWSGRRTITGGCSPCAGCSDRIAGWMKSYCGDLFRCEFFRGKHWFPRIFL